MNRKGDGFELEIGQPRQGSTHQSGLVLGPGGTVRCVGPSGAWIPEPRCEEPYYGSNVCMSVMKLKIIAFQGRVVKWIAENCEFSDYDCEKIAISQLKQFIFLSTIGRNRNVNNVI